MILSGWGSGDLHRGLGELLESSVLKTTRMRRTFQSSLIKLHFVSTSCQLLWTIEANHQHGEISSAAFLQYSTTSADRRSAQLHSSQQSHDPNKHARTSRGSMFSIDSRSSLDFQPCCFSRRPETFPCCVCEPIMDHRVTPSDLSMNPSAPSSGLLLCHPCNHSGEELLELLS